MTLSADGMLILDAGKAALPDVGRAYLAAGPDIAIVCEMIAVYPEVPDPKRQGANSGDFPGQCIYFPTTTWRAIYARDCWPLPDVQKSILPAPVDMTAWTKDYVDRCETFWGALLDLSLNQGCGRMTVEPGNYLGPSTGVAWFSVPIIIGPGV